MIQDLNCSRLSALERVDDQSHRNVDFTTWLRMQMTESTKIFQDCPLA